MNIYIPTNEVLEHFGGITAIVHMLGFWMCVFGFHYLYVGILRHVWFYTWKDPNPARRAPLEVRHDNETRMPWILCYIVAAFSLGFRFIYKASR